MKIPPAKILEPPHGWYTLKLSFHTMVGGLKTCLFCFLFPFLPKGKEKTFFYDFCDFSRLRFCFADDLSESAEIFFAQETFFMSLKFIFAKNAVWCWMMMMIKCINKDDFTWKIEIELVFVVKSWKLYIFQSKTWDFHFKNILWTFLSIWNKEKDEEELKGDLRMWKHYTRI